MARVNLGPAQVELGNLMAGRDASLVLTVTDSTGAAYTPSACTLHLYTPDTLTPVDSITGTITSGQVSFDLADVTALAAGSGVYRYEVVADDASWLVGPVDLRAVNSGRGVSGARTTTALTISNGQGTVSVTVNAAGATATALNAHVDDTTGAHAASAISVTPAGGIAATTVQTALAELDTEKATAAALASEESARISADSALDVRLDAIEGLGSLATDAEVTSAISTHSGATDPHGDRAFATSAVSTHEADTTSVHGITDTSTLYRAGGTDVAVVDGGTGASTAANARANLGLVVGTDVQAYDAELAAIAGLTSAADRLPYFTGSGTAALATFTAAGRALVDDADAAAQRTTLGAAAASDLTAHAALTTEVHGVTRQLLTFTPATPAHISGNLLSHDQQRGISGWPGLSGASSSAVAGGADGGGAIRMTMSSGFGYVNTTLVPVTALTTYTASIRVESAVAGIATVVIWWYDASLTYMSGSSSGGAVLGAALTLDVRDVAPAGCAFAAVVAVANSGWSSGDTVDVSVACLRTSATIPNSVGVSCPALGLDPSGGVCVALVAGELRLTHSTTSGGLFGYFTTPAVPSAVVLTAAVRVVLGSVDTHQAQILSGPTYAGPDVLIARVGSAAATAVSVVCGATRNAWSVPIIYIGSDGSTNGVVTAVSQMMLTTTEI